MIFPDLVLIPKGDKRPNVLDACKLTEYTDQKPAFNPVHYLAILLFIIFN